MNIGPIKYSLSVTPHDTNDITDAPCRAILVGVPGNVKVTYANGKTDTVYLAAGVWHYMVVDIIWSTGTAATGIHSGF